MLECGIWSSLNLGSQAVVPHNGSGINSLLSLHIHTKRMMFSGLCLSMVVDAPTALERPEFNPSTAKKRE